jgi:hypothetical protein
METIKQILSNFITPEIIIGLTVLAICLLT